MTSSSISLSLHFLITTTYLTHKLSLLTSAANGPSLSLGSSLSLNQSITSPDGLFQFGFFPLEAGLYLGVTFAHIKPITVAWVANRERPVSSAAVCSFTADGFVNLTDGSEVVWWIGGAGSGSAMLVVQNTSNLVLQRSNGSTIWQSFSHPGDEWLPGMSLGPGQKLQSWLTKTNPKGGYYSLMMGNNSNFVLVYNDTIQYWDSGPWNGFVFKNVPEMVNGYIYDFAFNRTSGFIYTVDPHQAASFGISKFAMASNGLIVESSYNPDKQEWNDFWSRPIDPCQVARLCGPNSLCDQAKQPSCACPSLGFRPVNQLEWDNSTFFHGCERKSPLNCSSGSTSNDEFLSINQTSFVWSFTSSLAMADPQKCKDLCLSNCSCNGFYFHGEAAPGNCSLFTDPLYDGIASSTSPVGGGAFYLRVAAIDLASDAEENGSKSRKLSTGLVLGVIAAVIAAVVTVSLAAWWVLRRRRILAAAKTPADAGLRAFTYSELQAATKNFKEKLGGGGFGTVFRGVIAVDAADFSATSGSPAVSRVVAVKKLHKLDEGEKQFRAEVRTIGTIQHINLVRLLGFCSEGKHRLLVYEIAENGSLDRVLFHAQDNTAHLPWHTRFNIALGAARGIAYLHESCRECIIHCDIKPENLLLDASYHVKVADFGLAKLVGREFSHVLTTLRGTRGYLAPEWIAGFSITAKADVYSYGMTILELISGHRNIMDHNANSTPTPTQDSDFFPIWVAQVIHQPEANLACILDPRLEGYASMEELQRMAYCAVWCIQDLEDSRPSMGKVVQMLDGTLPPTIPPIPRSLQCLLEFGSYEMK